MPEQQKGPSQRKFEDDGEGNQRDIEIYYFQCPDSHYVLVNPGEPRFNNKKPPLPFMTVCRGCGPNFQVRASKLLEGFVSSEELNRFTLKRPSGKSAKEI